MGGQRHAPAALPLEQTRYPLYRKLGGPQDRSGRVRNISPPPGFDPQTVQPVASLGLYLVSVLIKNSPAFRYVAKHHVENVQLSILTATNSRQIISTQLHIRTNDTLLTKVTLPLKFAVSCFLRRFVPFPGHGFTLRVFAITLRHTTLCSTPLDE